MCELGGELLAREGIEGTFVEHDCRIAGYIISAIKTFLTSQHLRIAIWETFSQPQRNFPQLPCVIPGDDNPLWDDELL